MLRPEKNIIMAKTKVRSATLDPNKVPSAIEGSPSSAELIEINVSGKIEITVTTIKPITYLDNRQLSAKKTEYFVASVAPFTTKNKDAIRIKKFSIII